VVPRDTQHTGCRPRNHGSYEDRRRLRDLLADPAIDCGGSPWSVLCCSYYRKLSQRHGSGEVELLCNGRSLQDPQTAGPNAPGGARDYVVEGHMTGGFAIVAFPARYGDSGIMTFIVNQNGIVYQKDLGPETATIARDMTQFDPDGTWTTP
jgi:hypothetical protein